MGQERGAVTLKPPSGPLECISAGPEVGVLGSGSPHSEGGKGGHGEKRGGPDRLAQAALILKEVLGNSLRGHLQPGVRLLGALTGEGS